MSINDPQWGNSHRPEKKEPEQVPESTGTEPVQPKDEQHAAPALETSSPTPNPPRNSAPPPEGPPDLEELWRQIVYKMRCRLARLRGQKLPSPPEPLALPVPIVSTPAAGNDVLPLAGWQALSLRSWLIGVSLIFGAWLISGFYLVDTSQRGVLSRFGRIVAIEDPGWHWRWPTPIDRVRLINVTADRTLEVGFSAQKDQRQSPGLMQTADGNLLGVAYAVTYQVTDPVAYLSRADEPTDLIALLAETSVREAVAAQTLPTIMATVGSPTTTLGAHSLQTALADLQAAVASLKLGVEIKGVAIRDGQLPTPVQQAIKSTEREAQTRMKALREAQTTATDNLIKARKLAMALQDESVSYAQALAVQRQMLQTGAAQTDAASALKALAEKSAGWRAQFPLMFASLTMLQERIQPAARGDQATPGAPNSANADRASTRDTESWRDRERMRSRERIDRSGSGL